MKIICKYDNLQIEIETIISFHEDGLYNHSLMNNEIKIKLFIEYFFGKENIIYINSTEIKKAIILNDFIYDDIELKKGDFIEFDRKGIIKYDYSKIIFYKDRINKHPEISYASSIEPKKNNAHHEDGGKFLGYHRRELRKWGSLPTYDNYDDEKPEFPFGRNEL
jgi:hypothetical protein